MANSWTSGSGASIYVHFDGSADPKRKRSLIRRCRDAWRAFWHGFPRHPMVEPFAWLDDEPDTYEG